METCMYFTEGTIFIRNIILPIENCLTGHFTSEYCQTQIHLDASVIQITESVRTKCNKIKAMQYWI